MKQKVITEGDTIGAEDNQTLILIAEDIHFVLRPTNAWGVVFRQFPDAALDFAEDQEKQPADEVFGPDDTVIVGEEVTFIAPIRLQAKKAGAKATMVGVPQTRCDDGGVVAGVPFSIDFQVVEKGSRNFERG